MEKRNSKTLVRKTRAVAILLILSLSSNAFAATLTVHWDLRASTACQSLVQTFLEELRSVAADHTIVVEPKESADASKAAENSITLNCPGAETIEASAKTPAKEETKYLFRYIPSMKTLESADWIPFQDQFLSMVQDKPLSQNLTLQDIGTQQSYSAVEKAPALATESISEPESGKSKPLFQKWWFWGIVASAVGTSAYLLVNANSQPSTATIQVR